jgi:hypothetical protein
MKKKQPKRTRIIDDIETLWFHAKNCMDYETLGDWNDAGTITVYDKLDKVEQLAVGIHELVEMVLLHLRGITAEEVTKWDTEDTEGKYDPNMYDKSPEYKAAHTLAELVERSIIEAADRDWDTYSKKCDNMKIKWKKSTT